MTRPERRVRFRPLAEPLEARDLPAGIFAPPATIASPNLGPQTTVLAVADFNNDTKADVAVTNYGSGNPSTLSVLLGKGDGTFNPATAVTVDSGAAGRLPEGLAALDFDADGDPDLAVVLNQGNANNVVILRNKGLFTGTFEIAQVMTAGSSATHLVAADFNGDTRPDLAVSNYGGGVNVFLNNAGAFPAAPPLTATEGGNTGGNVIVAVDLTGDGRPELAVANQILGNVTVLANDGSGGFSKSGTLTASPGTTFLAAGDLDGDGKADLVASNTFHPPTGTAGTTVSLFYGKGGGAFDSAVAVTVGSIPTGVVIRDFTGDGLPDVAVGVVSTGQVAVLRNNGGRDFLSVVGFDAIAGANGLAVTDLNKDGKPDLIVTQYDAGDNLAVLLNQLTKTSVAVAVPPPTGVGQPATFTATVTPAVGGAPTTGFVSFLDGGTFLGTMAVSDGTAQFTTTALAVGSHSIRVVYSDAVSQTWYGSQSAGTPFTVTVSPGTPQTYLAIGGEPGRVVVRTAAGAAVTDFRPYGNSYAGAVSVAWGDVNGDGHRDLVTGALTGNPHVLVFSGKAFADGTFSPANPYAALLASFFPYGLGFNVGSNVAAGDFDGDGFAEVVTGASPGNPHVEVYDGKTLPGTYTGGNPFGSLRTSFFAYGVGFNVGAYVAVGDVDGDGTPELVTGSSRGNPHVLVFRGTALADRTLTDANKYSNLLGSFYSYGLSFNVGAAVAVGDVDGDGKAEVITGSSVGSPHVKVYAGAAFAAGTFSGANPDASLVGSFFAYQPANGRGATVAAVDVNGDGKKEVLTGSTGVPRWRVVSGTSTGTLPAAVLDVTETVLLGGISVGG